MARTIIGELLLRIKADTREAKSVTDALKNIEAHSKTLGNAPWGAGMQRTLEKLKATPREIDRVHRSWDELTRAMSTNNLDKALRKSHVSIWRQATIGHLTALRAEYEKLGKRHDVIMQRIREGARLGLGAAGVYGSVQGIRSGARASGERQREYFRQEMAGLPEKDRKLMTDRAVELSGQYPSASATDIMEMARVAYTTMGGAERGNQILPGLVKGLVTLQSSKGVGAAPEMLNRLLNGIDNVGKNSMDDVGVKNTLDIIDGIVRAAQIENGEIDPGKLFDFARRSKIAGPGLSSKFIATTAPAFMQDMTAEGFGTALSSAFQAFVIGANSNSSKVNIQAQRDLGLRVGNGNAGKGELVDSELFGHDPYAWVKKNLVPALAKGGVNIEDETAVAKAVAQLTKNTNASGLLTRMITQREQTDRKREQYAKAMGTDAADQAAAQDPFVAWSGMTTSLENLSAAIGETVMPVIVPGLNGVSGAINSFGKALKDGNVLAWGALGAGSVAAGGAALGAGKAFADLAFAGPALKGAAASLEAAAGSIRNGGTPTGKPDGQNPKGNPLGLLWGLAGGYYLGNQIHDGADAATSGAIEALGGKPAKLPSAGENALYLWGMMTEALKARGPDIYSDGGRDYSLRAFFDGGRGDSLRAFLDGPGVTPDVLAPDHSEAVSSAQNAGQQMQDALNVEAKPSVDVGPLQAALLIVRQLRAELDGLGGAISRKTADLESQLKRSFTDHQLTVVE